MKAFSTTHGAEYERSLERYRDLHVEREKKRTDGEFTFVKLGENE